MLLGRLNSKMKSKSILHIVLLLFSFPNARTNSANKRAAALILVVLMVTAILFTAVNMTKASTSGTISLVYSGTANQTTISGQNLGSKFNVDVRADNIPSTANGINGYTYMVTWDPTVLALENINDPGSYIGTSIYNRYVTSIDLNSTSNALIVNGIIIDTSNSNAGVVSSSGILSTLTFIVISAGRSNLNLEPSSSGSAYLVTPVAGQSQDVLMNAISALYNPTTSVSLYQTGTNNPTIFYSGNPIGSTVSVDIVMNNPLAVNVWGWNVGLTWNPAVLACTGVVEGTYLNPSPGLYSGSSTLFVVGNINNQLGTIQQGISDVYLTNRTQNAGEGVLATATFQILQYANSYINITYVTPTLANNYEQSISTLINNATYISETSPTPVSPIAELRDDTPLTGGATSYLPNATMTLDALLSNPGIDLLPNAASPSFPILQYTWVVTSGSSLTVPSSGSTISFQTPNVSSLTSYTISLTVATAANPSDSRYLNTSTPVTITFTVGGWNPGPPSEFGAQIDVFVVNPANPNQIYPSIYPFGYGLDQPGGTFVPQELLNLTALATWNGGSAANKLVTFTVGNSTDIVATFVAYTDSNGYAFAFFSLPDVGSVMSFGTYEVNASVDIAQNYAIDTMPFEYSAVGSSPILPTENGAVIDVYVVNPANSSNIAPAVNPFGYGYWQPADAFAPQELMNLTAFVSWNNGSVADKLVTFTVGNSTNVIATFVAYTDANGYALAQYRLPNYASSANMPFGTYQVNASVVLPELRD